ncbi:p21-activated protein kinase-interacting protein 1-like [Mizuhopecten yessoensis]|uniref:p21-activated protein kinase-interacting protein 1-like n=1 Tax=Mizuhopecten yessoensis TaxID=6573 RepID=A0A210QBD6_MIZYE|nr:p21-activated protein kinase-interacting protein 1-like [Mizuhopecten yessoensis]OWF46043.1 p21-activated protein kinase-interacting protein 1-like [Mizuhopecten yessoensis]
MEVIVGTYDEVLLGYKIITDAEEYQFDQSFTDHTHTGCIKTLSVSKKGILASGGTDETVRLINLKKRTELGSLVQHSGTVTCLKFHHGSHLFSTSEDGTIAIWKYFTWECLKTLRGHTSTVNCISIHPSGKLALSVGRDKTLRTWNLITGRSAYTTNIKQEASLVVWSLNGNHYAVVFSTKIDIYNTQTAEVISSVKTTQRVNDLAFISTTVIVYGGEGGQLYFYNIINKMTLHSLDTQTNRVRAMSIVPAPVKEGEESNENNHWLFTASSDGHIKIFQVQMAEDKVDTSLVISHNTTFRLTCMAVSLFKSKPKEGTKTDCQADEKLIDTSQEMAADKKLIDTSQEKSQKTVANRKSGNSKKVSWKRKAETDSQDSGVNVSCETVEVNIEDESEDENTKVKGKKLKHSKKVKDKGPEKLKQLQGKRSEKSKRKGIILESQPKRKKIKT